MSPRFVAQPDLQAEAAAQRARIQSAMTRLIEKIDTSEICSLDSKENNAQATVNAWGSVETTTGRER